jgi:hypothetical protein
MLSGEFRQADDGIGVDVDEAAGLSDAAALGKVLEQGAGLLRGQVGMEQSCPLALGEAVLAGVAIEQADVILCAVAGADGEIAGVPLAVEDAIGLLAAEASEVVHGIGSPRRPRRVGLRDWEWDTSDITTLIPYPVFSSSLTRPTFCRVIHP